MAFRRVIWWRRVNGVVDICKKSLHSSRRNMASDDGKKSSDRNCDPGICPRHQMDMKQMLERKEMEHLQPSRSRFDINTFSISRPHVDRYVNPELEEICLQKKKCDELKKGGKSKDNDKK
uniref:Uncharacterized protein n=1 Tax=Lygus hesperus TaxID=30085 RepID=A0A0A9YLE4_LYGHE